VLPTTFNNPMKKEDRWIGDRDYANVLHHALHGGGSRHLGANRWFDKTFHAILGKVRLTYIYNCYKSTVDLVNALRFRIYGISFIGTILLIITLIIASFASK